MATASAHQDFKVTIVVDVAMACSARHVNTSVHQIPVEGWDDAMYLETVNVCIRLQARLASCANLVSSAKDASSLAMRMQHAVEMGAVLEMGAALATPALQVQTVQFV